eukprot:Clim_evm6s42 gene=Clim_evmTU6s42
MRFGFVVSNIAVVAIGSASAQWTNIRKADTDPILPVLPTDGTSSAPGVRWDTATAYTSDSNLYLFGGKGYVESASGDANETLFKDLNDLWAYDIIEDKWNAIRAPGNDTGYFAGNGAPVVQAIPSARHSHCMVASDSGLLYVYGGSGFDKTGEYGDLGDLWVYNRELNAWGWVSGSGLAFEPRNGIAVNAVDAASAPGARQGHSCAMDREGNFWVFGGYGMSSRRTYGLLADLWKYDVSQKVWIWIKGPPSINQESFIVSQDILNGIVVDDQIRSNPSARANSVLVHSGQERDGFYLFGGYGVGSSQDGNGYLADTWLFNVTSSYWFLLKGPTTVNSPSDSDGDITQARITNPGGRSRVAGAGVTPDDRLVIYGGYGIGADRADNATAAVASQAGYLEDVWIYDMELDPLNLGEWTYVGGAMNDKNTPVSATSPGARAASYSWMDQAGFLSVGGGQSRTSDGGWVSLQDLWVYDALEAVGSANTRTMGPNCASGYEAVPAPDGSGQSFCVDVNDCLQSNGGCQFVCQNFSGSSNCLCKPPALNSEGIPVSDDKCAADADSAKPPFSELGAVNVSSENQDASGDSGDDDVNPAVIYVPVMAVLALAIGFFTYAMWRMNKQLRGAMGDDTASSNDGTASAKRLSDAAYYSSEKCGSGKSGLAAASFDRTVLGKQNSTISVANQSTTNEHSSTVSYDRSETTLPTSGNLSDTYASGHSQTSMSYAGVNRLAPSAALGVGLGAGLASGAAGARYMRTSTQSTQSSMVQSFSSVNSAEVQRDTEAAGITYMDAGHLSLGRLLGSGSLGEVFIAILNEDNPSSSDGSTGVAVNGTTTVAVKKVRAQRMDNLARDDLLNEACTMSNLSHPNIVKLIGLTLFADGPLGIITEFCHLGALESYMWQFGKSLPQRQLLLFAQQVADGMAYLESMNVVHRDLAARNVLLDANGAAKIADFGLSRALHADENYYTANSARALPLRWLAPESITRRKFSSKADVWSFAVLVWEIYDFCDRVPYPNIADQKIIAYLEQGGRVELPSTCPAHVRACIARCFELQPKLRPNFAEVVTMLAGGHVPLPVVNSDELYSRSHLSLTGSTGSSV